MAHSSRRRSWKAKERDRQARRRQRKETESLEKRPLLRPSYDSTLCPGWSNGPKAQHRTPQDAEAEKGRLELASPHLIFEVFRCRRCRFWHVGKPSENYQRLDEYLWEEGA